MQIERELPVRENGQAKANVLPRSHTTLFLVHTHPLIQIVLCRPSLYLDKGICQCLTERESTYFMKVRKRDPVSRDRKGENDRVKKGGLRRDIDRE